MEESMSKPASKSPTSRTQRRREQNLDTAIRRKQRNEQKRQGLFGKRHLKQTDDQPVLPATAG
jgi:hypothetical protein